jgi:hypothetical protein
MQAKLKRGRGAPIERRSDLGSPAPTEPGSRAEKAGDKGMEIQDHAITGPPSPQCPRPFAFAQRLKHPPDWENNQLRLRDGGEGPREASVVDGTRGQQLGAIEHIYDKRQNAASI